MGCSAVTLTVNVNLPRNLFDISNTVLPSSCMSAWSASVLPSPAWMWGSSSWSVARVMVPCSGATRGNTCTTSRHYRHQPTTARPHLVHLQAPGGLRGEERHQDGEQ